MGITTGTALAIGIGTSAAGSMASGIMGYNAAGQAGAAETKAAQEGIQSIQQYGGQGISALQAAAKGYQPYSAAGLTGLTALQQALSTPGKGLLTPWSQQFQAPTAAQAAATPGYQFALQQGLNAITSTSAAQGGLLSGATMKQLNNYAQGMASTNYQQTYNNAFQNYLQNYNQFQQNQANQYNRLAGLTSLGQFGQQGQMQAAGAEANIYGNMGQSIASLYGNIGQATAAADINQANAFGSMAQSLGQLPLQYAQGQMGIQYLQNMGNNPGYSMGGPGTPLYSPSSYTYNPAPLPGVAPNSYSGIYTPPNPALSLSPSSNMFASSYNQQSPFSPFSTSNYNQDLLGLTGITG